MKKTALAALLIIASGAAQAETLEANAEYDMQILADGVSCFIFGDCVNNPSATSDFTDNDNDAAATNGSAISGDGLAGFLTITTTSDGAGGVNFTVNSFNMDTYIGTAGGAFGTWADNTSAMSGSVDASGNVTLDLTGRMGIAEYYVASLGEQEWNLDTHGTGAGAIYCNAIQTGNYTLFTTGSSSNINCGTGAANLTLTGSPVDASFNATLVSAGNVGLEWGFFDGTPYSEVFSVHFVRTNRAPVAQNDAVSIDQNTSDNIISVLIDNGSGADSDADLDTLSISAVGTPSNGGTASISGTDILYTPPADLTVQSDSFTYTISDGSLTSTATVTVTINDTTNPVITLNGASTIDVYLNGTYTELNAVCSDNFDADTTVTPNTIVPGGSVDTSVEQVYTITYVCQDAAGNNATDVIRSVNVAATINDTTAPTITLSGSNPVTHTVNTAYVDAGAACADNLDPSPTFTTDTSNVDTSTPGSYSVDYTCVDHATVPNSSTVSRTVNVVDNVAPVITLNGDNPFNLVIGSSYVEPGALCADNYDADKAATVSGTVTESPVGTTSVVTYTCSDNAGNPATPVTRTVNVISQGPVITLNGDASVVVYLGDTYTEQGAICADDVDASKPAVVSGDTVDSSTLGAYTVRYNCTDSDGNAATEVTRTVTVSTDTEAPTISLNGPTSVELNQGFTYFEQGAVCSDNRDADKAATIAGDTVDTSTVGSYTLRYECSDMVGNLATPVTRTVTIISKEPAPISEDEGNALGGNAFGGCSISSTSRKPLDGGEWLLVGGFLALLGLRRRSTRS